MAIEIWQMDPRRSDIKFTLRHPFLASMSGQARRWKATLRIDRDRPSRSSVEVIIDAGSLDTDEPERDEFLRSPAFLNVRVHPEIRFSSTKVIPQGSARYLIKGNLTIGAVTRKMTLEVSDLERLTGGDGENHANFRGHAAVDRQTFGLHWSEDSEKGGIVMADKVEIDISLGATRTVMTSASSSSRRAEDHGVRQTL